MCSKEAVLSFKRIVVNLKRIVVKTLNNECHKLWRFLGPVPVNVNLREESGHFIDFLIGKIKNNPTHV